jgi:hypothetical protein
MMPPDGNGGGDPAWWSELRKELAKGGAEAGLARFRNSLLAPDPPLPAGLREQILKALVQIASRPGEIADPTPRRDPTAVLRELDRGEQADLGRFASDLLPPARPAPASFAHDVLVRVRSEASSPPLRTRWREGLRNLRVPTLLAGFGAAAAVAGIVFATYQSGDNDLGITAAQTSASAKASFGWAQGDPISGETEARISAELEVFAAGLLWQVSRLEGDRQALTLLGRLHQSTAAAVMGRGRAEPLLTEIVRTALERGSFPRSVAEHVAATPEPILSLDQDSANVLSGAALALADAGMTSSGGRAALPSLLLRLRDHCPENGRAFAELSLRLAELARDRGDRDAAERYLQDVASSGDIDMQLRAGDLREGLR